MVFFSKIGWKVNELEKTFEEAFDMISIFSPYNRSESSIFRIQIRMNLEKNIHNIGKEELHLVHHIARKTWPIAYGEILGKEQLDYMLNRFYSFSSLSESMDSGHLYYLYVENENPLGFVSIQFMDDGKSMKIHKLYVLPNQQGKGIGERLFQKAVCTLVDKGFKRLFLNVNRFNSALQFYLRMEMKIEKEENIDIGQGYWMEDYVLEKIFD
jgi:GNAT superfamily N-acetyltransferase